MTIETRMDKLEEAGGRLCLDFANTTSGREMAEPSEHLTSYGELVAWGLYAGVLTEERASTLIARSQRQTKEAEAVLERAIAMREAVYRVFSASARGAAPARADLATLNEALPEALSHLRLDHALGGYSLDWAADGELDQMLWPVVSSAARLLTSDELDRVRECGGLGCNWLFVDTSKNRSRKWCDMGDCGNRAKARRYYARKKAQATRTTNDQVRSVPASPSSPL